ncbi:MAG: hypothetical protein MJ147_02100 [Clostridia bacterium]|nr:hypothetical protein [Clostridia bacterium]
MLKARVPLFQGLFTYLSKDNNVLYLIIIYLIVAFLAILFSYFIFPDVFPNFQKSNKYYDHYKKLIDDGKAANPDKNRTPKDTNSISLMASNLAQIRLHYEWSQKQARASFRLAWILCVSGITLILFAVALPMKYSELLVSHSVILAAGGAVTELLAYGTMRIYKNALTQLNQYQRSLRENERFLSSVNMLDRFTTEEQRDKMLSKILESEIDYKPKERDKMPVPIFNPKDRKNYYISADGRITEIKISDNDL